MEAALSFSGVEKRFGSRRAVDGLSLEVPRDAIFGLIGPNGAGKTTTFSLACGFLRPDAGKMKILGVDGFDVGRLKGRVTAMPQDATLGRETRCIEHLIFYARLQGLSAADARRDAERTLGEVGLADRARSKTKTLSHGMLRRLAVAQALVGRPELVLLDEPTSGLDPRHAHELRDLLRRSRAGRTLVISSHNLPELETLCDHVAFIDHGKVLTAGRTDTLTGKGEEIQIHLGDGAAPVEAVQAALAADDVQWEPDARVLRIRFQLAPGRATEDVVGTALRVLLGAGARISEVRRGTTLERKFLELT